MAVILVVEDDKNILELVRFNLERQGYQVLSAVDGSQCLDLARTQAPDLILLDVMLPQMDGLEVCQALRRDTATKDIPVIMLSARAAEMDRLLGLEMGADDYVTKPFSLRALTAMVKTRLHHGRSGGV